MKLRDQTDPAEAEVLIQQDLSVSEAWGSRRQN